MGRTITPGSTNESTEIRIIDSTAGTVEEGVTKDTGGLALWYRREGAIKVVITPITDLSLLSDAHSDGGMLHVDDGYYRVDVPDAAFASGADYVTIGGTATGMIVIAAHHPIGIRASGEDAFTGTLTINDGATGLEGAVVNASRGGVVKAVGTTNASGQITDWVFGAYTYTFAVRLAGYGPETDTLAVSANGWSKTISLTAITITPPAAVTLCTVQLVLKIGDTPVQGATFKANLIGQNQAADGTILSTAEVSDTTDASGIAELQLVRLDAIAKGNGLYSIVVLVDDDVFAKVKTTIPNASTAIFEDLIT